MCIRDRRKGAEYLEELGFDKKFCRICEQANRIANITPRDKEGDILELIDNFGMLLDRDDRRAFNPTEALFVLENENLKGLENVYLQDFKEFVMEFENLETLGLDKSKIITRWQTKINMIPKYNLAQGINAAIDYRTTAKKLYIEGKKLEVNKKDVYKRQVVCNSCYVCNGMRSRRKFRCKVYHTNRYINGVWISK